MRMDALMTNIYVTGHCDKKCPDCYYPQRPHMNYTTAWDVALWVCRLYSSEEIKSFKVHFLGGEPLENIGVVRYLIDRINILKPLFTSPHPDGEYVIFSNGDLLDSASLLDLKIRNVKIMLNPTRTSLGGMEGRIRTIKGIMGGCSLSVVLDELNMDRLPDLARLAIKYKCHMRINRLYQGGTIPGYVERYKEQMRRVFGILLESDWIMWPNFIMESTYPTWKGAKNCNACGRWFLVVDPDGTVRSCNADLETKIGSIYTHRRMDDFVFSHRWSAKDLPECQGCDWITWCQGGCPYTRKLTYGTYQKRTPFCEAFKELFPLLMELKNKWEKIRR